MRGGRTTAVQPPKKVQKSFVVGKGGFQARVYPTPFRGKLRWTVTWVSPTGRERKVFGGVGAKGRARKHALTVSSQRSEGVVKVMGHEEMAGARRGRQLLKRWGVSIEVACAWVAQIKAAGAEVSTLLDLWKRQKATKSVSIAVGVEEFLAAKKQDGAGELHQEGLASRLGRFRDENAGTVDALTPDRLDAWLRGLRKIEGDKLGGPLEPQTRNHYRAALLNFLGFARRRRWIAWLPADFAEF